MLKGYRTYISAGLAIVVEILTAAEPNLKGPTATTVKVILGMAAMYFRSQA